MTLSHFMGTKKKSFEISRIRKKTRVYDVHELLLGNLVTHDDLI